MLQQARVNVIDLTNVQSNDAANHSKFATGEVVTRDRRPACGGPDAVGRQARPRRVARNLHQGRRQRRHRRHGRRGHGPGPAHRPDPARKVGRHRGGGRHAREVTRLRRPDRGMDCDPGERAGIFSPSRFQGLRRQNLQLWQLPSAREVCRPLGVVFAMPNAALLGSRPGGTVQSWQACHVFKALSAQSCHKCNSQAPEGRWARGRSLADEGRDPRLPTGMRAPCQLPSPF